MTTPESTIEISILARIKVAHENRVKATEQMEMLDEADARFHGMNSYRWECEDAYSDLIRQIIGTPDQNIIDGWDAAYRTLRVRAA